MLRTSPEQFEMLARQGNHIPVVREILADLDTPLSLFRKIDDGRTAFLLESVEVCAFKVRTPADGPCIFTGRTAIYEVLPIDEAVREQIVDRASATKIKRDALKRGLVTLRMDGIRKVKQGDTTLQEVLRVTQMDIE